MLLNIFMNRMQTLPKSHSQTIKKKKNHHILSQFILICKYNHTVIININWQILIQAITVTLHFSALICAMLVVKKKKSINIYFKSFSHPTITHIHWYLQCYFYLHQLLYLQYYLYLKQFLYIFALYIELSQWVALIQTFLLEGEKKSINIVIIQPSNNLINSLISIQPTIAFTLKFQIPISKNFHSCNGNNSNITISAENQKCLNDIGFVQQ